MLFDPKMAALIQFLVYLARNNPGVKLRFSKGATFVRLMEGMGRGNPDQSIALARFSLSTFAARACRSAGFEKEADTLASFEGDVYRDLEVVNEIFFELENRLTPDEVDALESREPASNLKMAAVSSINYAVYAFMVAQSESAMGAEFEERRPHMHEVGTFAAKAAICAMAGAPKQTVKDIDRFYQTVDFGKEPVSNETAESKANRKGMKVLAGDK